MVEKQQPAEESGIEFDLDSAQAACDAAAEAEAELDATAPKGAAKILRDDGPFMRFVWWTLRTVLSFVVPLGVFYAMVRCKPLVDGAYHMINPGTNPYPILMKGGLATFLAALIASVPAFTGMYLASLLSRFKNLKPTIAVAIWCLLVFFDSLIFVVVAKYFTLI
ncbi:MAG: hypothetical protein IT343_15135 [Candidatus Melainabacteria bacterium]|nr:hypothetical protein [Candidatus Melainabacteria bacterium]